MSKVIVDGVEYMAGATARYGVAITTKDRPREFAKAIEQHQKHSRGAVLVVVDDGSAPAARVPEGVTLIRHDKSEGIVAAKNASLVFLMDAGCDYFSLWDDDAYPIVDGWVDSYVESPEGHLAYQFLDLAGPRKLNDIIVLYQDAQHVAYSGQRGVMLWYRRDVIEKVGGFDPIYGRGMYEHSDLANRIHRNGLTSFRYMEVTGSNRLIYSMDEHEAVKRSVPVSDRQKLVRQNAEMHNRRMDRDYYPAFVPYRELRNVVITCLYGNITDPQRKGQRMTVDQLQPLFSSVRGADVVVYTDQGSVAGVTTIPAELDGVNVFTKRWLDAYQYLRDNPGIQWATVCDGMDVEMLHEPWPYLEIGKLYVGYQPSIVANEWLRKNHPDPKVQAFIDQHPDETLLNAGVVAGTGQPSWHSPTGWSAITSTGHGTSFTSGTGPEKTSETWAHSRSSPANSASSTARESPQRSARTNATAGPGSSTSEVTVRFIVVGHPSRARQAHRLAVSLDAALIMDHRSDGAYATPSCRTVRRTRDHPRR